MVEKVNNSLLAGTVFAENVQLLGEQCFGIFLKNLLP